MSAGDDRPARRLTPAGQHFFHGYYGVQPWNPGGDLFACHRLPFMDRMPGPGDMAQVGVVSDGEFEVIGESSAWNYQVGTMMQWVPGRGDTLVYNVFEDGVYRARTVELHSGRTTELGHPVSFQVARNGSFAIGHNFARLAGRRDGYAYAAHHDDRSGVDAPDDDGIRRIDLATGEASLLASFAELAERFSTPTGRALIVGRIVINPADDRFGFTFRFADAAGVWHTTLVTSSPDGEDLCQVVPFDRRPKHWDWFDDRHLVVWSSWEREGFHVIQDHTGWRRPFGRSILLEDGHITVEPERRNVAVDTFPDRNGDQWLFVLEAGTTNLERFGPYAAPSLGSIDLRCDLHPCWNRQGDAVTFDSIHEGYRGCYLIEPDLAWIG